MWHNDKPKKQGNKKNKGKRGGGRQNLKKGEARNIGGFTKQGVRNPLPTMSDANFDANFEYVMFSPFGFYLTKLYYKI